MEATGARDSRTSTSAQGLVFDVDAGPAGIDAFLVERTRAGLSNAAPYDLVGCHSMGLERVGKAGANSRISASGEPLRLPPVTLCRLSTSDVCLRPVFVAIARSPAVSSDLSHLLGHIVSSDERPGICHQALYDLFRRHDRADGCHTGACGKAHLLMIASRLRGR
jgi:hypothetical protein